MAVENVILTTDNCRYCLMCRHVCPVEHTMHLESLSPHGWGLLIASQRRGLVEWNAETVDRLYSCADCGACRAHCVTDQPLPEAIAAARAEVAELGLAPAAVCEVRDALEQYGNPYKSVTSVTEVRQGDVALFVGDDAAVTWPGALEAALRLLKAAGVEPALIGVGRNSGYLASSLGFPETAKRLARATLDELAAAGAKTLLVLNPGDYFAFSQMAGERLGIAWPEGVALIDVAVFLAGALSEGRIAFRKLSDETPYAYIDPAHTVRVKDRVDAPRALLAAVMPQPGRELFWRRDRTHPAGSTSLRFSQPQIASHLTWARLGDAARTGARLLICEDAGTLAQLSQHAERFGLRVQGLYELLAAQLA
jgi:Fe-S oxidoreductase